MNLKLRLREGGVSAAELVIGILLLIDPAGFTKGILIAGGILLLMYGIAALYRYFRLEPEETVQQYLLCKGLLAVLGGVFCVLNPQWFLAAFPVLTFFYGILILLSGIVKLQWTVDLIRLKGKRWGWVLAGAVISLLGGLVILANPFRSAAVLWLFIGVSLIVSAVCDLLTALLGKKKE